MTDWGVWLMGLSHHSEGERGALGLGVGGGQGFRFWRTVVLIWRNRGVWALEEDVGLGSVEGKGFGRKGFWGENRKVYIITPQNQNTIKKVPNVTKTSFILHIVFNNLYYCSHIITNILLCILYF